MKFIKLFLLTFLLSFNLLAATLYCDYTNGNDSNNCTNGTTELCKTLQRCVDVASGGDTINIANTSAQILAASITWNTGFTADNTKYTIFQAWDNGGSLTIQRPDEATARVGATIDGNGASLIFSNTSKPQRIALINLKLTNVTDSGIHSGAWWTGYGLEISNIGNGAAPLRITYYDDFRYLYIHTFDDYGVWLDGDSWNFSDSFIDATSNTPVNAVLANATIESNFKNNIIKSKNATTAVRFNNSARNFIAGNTIVGDGTASSSAKGFDISGTSTDISFVNNLIYSYGGSGAVPYSFASAMSTRMIGYNAVYDSNAPVLPTLIGINLTANDITGSGDPFVDSANNDFTPTVASGARGVGLSNPNSYLDIGAVQAVSSGGGSGSGSVIIINE